MCCDFLWNIKSLKCAKQHRYVNILIYQISLTSKLNIDRAADITIVEIKQKDSLRNLIEIHSNKNIYSFYLQPLATFLIKQKLGSSVANCLNPSHITNLASSSASFKLLVDRLVRLKILPAKTGDKALSQLTGFIVNYVKEEPKKIISFNPKWFLF